MPQSCKVCRLPGNEELRESWGCDGESKVPFYIDDCPFCDGEAGTCLAGCNKGRLEFRRCPNATLPEEAHLVVRYAALIETGILPIAGGMEQQSASFVDALMIVLSKKGELEEKAYAK